MAEDRADLLRHYGNKRAELLAVIDGLDDAALMERTIDGWSVKDHLLHIAYWDGLRAEDMRRISAGHETAWKLEGRDDEVNAVVYDMRRDLSLEQARWEVAVTHEAVLSAIREMSERGLDGSLYGEMGLRGGHEAAHTAWIARWREGRGV
jgi:hypothetical protein